VITECIKISCFFSFVVKAFNVVTLWL